MDNPFKKIIGGGLSFLKSSGSDGSVLGIDIGSSSVKVVQLKKKGGKAVLETYGALALGPYGELEVGQLTNLPNDALATAITDVLRESTTTTKDAGVSIPASGSLIFVVEIPPQIDEKNFDTVVPTEARKYIPVPVSEVTLDWSVIPKRAESFDGVPEESDSGPLAPTKSEVLVAAIHNDTLTRYHDVVKAADIHASFFEIEVFSSVRATFNHELSSVMLLDMGASKTKIAIVEHGVIREFHSVNRGSSDITSSLAKSLGIPFSKAEELKRQYGLVGNPEDKNISEIAMISVDYILSEVQSVILNYEKKYNQVISKVILAGGGALLRGFVDVARRNLKCEVVLGNPFGKVEAPAFLEPVLEMTGPEFAVALGIAMRKLE